MADKLRLAMLISGRGSTAANIITACGAGRLKGIEPACIIASRIDVGEAVKPVVEAIPFLVIPPSRESPEEFGERILGACRVWEVDLIGQYGWMVKTPPNVIAAYPERMINQHPGPLDPGKPDFGGKGMYGRRVHQAVLNFAREVDREFSWTEATVQRVAKEYDEGAVLGRRQVPILEGETADSLAARVLPEEHKLQIEVLRVFAVGTVAELTREAPLILSGEEATLEKAKTEAIKQFPNG